MSPLNVRMFDGKDGTKYKWKRAGSTTVLRVVMMRFRL